MKLRFATQLKEIRLNQKKFDCGELHESKVDSHKRRQCSMLELDLIEKYEF